jgi:hypothetical protein
MAVPTESGGADRKLGLPLAHCHVHTCIHVVGPPTGLAAAGCRGAACPRIEYVVNRALHLTVIDGLGALGGAGEGGESQVGEAPGSLLVLRPRSGTLMALSAEWVLPTQVLLGSHSQDTQL